MAFALIYTGHIFKEEFGYGFMVIIMFTMVLPLLFVIVLHLFIGALFNRRPPHMLSKLRRLKDLYGQMERLQKEHKMTKLGPKMQFLFEVIKEKKAVDFKALRKKESRHDD